TVQKITIPNHCTGKIVKFVQSLAKPLCIGIESMGSYYWLWDLLEPLADEIHLIDALDLSKLRPRMADTDKIVATKIAHIMKSEYVPVAYVPPLEIRHLRMYGRQWHRITREGSRIKTVIRWELYQANTRGPKAITAASMHRWLLANGEKLNTVQAQILWQDFERIHNIERQRDAILRDIRGIVKADQQIQSRLAILTSPKGISEVLGFIILAEFGDFGRFKNADAVACWTGLTERSHISNRQKYPGQISKAGSATLRWALSEAAFEMTKFDANFKASYQRLLKKTGIKGKARTAMARRLARILWKMVVSDTPFRAGSNPDKSVQRANEVKQRRKSKQQKRKEFFAEKNELATV
ncbi:MAG: IS110 family transposase, partial [Desulfobulbaceae bacterium]|nr:IS110 family transposase [Desulfobulbaceae bacterium]